MSWETLWVRSPNSQPVSGPKDFGILLKCGYTGLTEDIKYADHSDFLGVLNKSVPLSLNPMASMSVVLSQSMTQTDTRAHIHTFCVFRFRKTIHRISYFKANLKSEFIMF